MKTTRTPSFSVISGGPYGVSWERSYSSQWRAIPKLMVKSHTKKRVEQFVGKENIREIQKVFNEGQILLKEGEPNKDLDSQLEDTQEVEDHQAYTGRVTMEKLRKLQQQVLQTIEIIKSLDNSSLGPSSLLCTNE
ncbi:hypothetical protein CR513_15992, partial [Mucuna pruriens]